MRRWLIAAKANAAFVAAMELLLAVYARPVDARTPLVCFDESGKELRSHAQPPQAARPGQVRREDPEYVRDGSANLFLTYAPYLGWRQITVTERRTAIDFAHAVRHLVDDCFPDAERITLVLDNLNTHTPASLYKAFKPDEAWRLLQKLEWVFTPTHGSWLNMAELEWSVAQRQCLARRLPTIQELQHELDAWTEARNAERITASWHFTKEDARQKLSWLYPCPQ